MDKETGNVLVGLGNMTSQSNGFTDLERGAGTDISDDHTLPPMPSTTEKVIQRALPWDLYEDASANPLTRTFKHDLDWLLLFEKKSSSNAYAVELISSSSGVSNIAGQSSFHSIENKNGGKCEECGSERRWDQKHDEMICIGCGLVYSDVSEEVTWPEDSDFIERMANEEDYIEAIEAYDEGFMEYYNPGLANNVLPNYGHLSDNELDLMVGSRNRTRIREINDTKKNPALKNLKAFTLSELGSKDYIELHEGIFGDLLGRPTKVPLSRIRLDPLIKERPSINMVSCKIKFSLEMNRRTKKPKRLLGISSEIALPEAQQKDIYELWMEQKKVEHTYNKYHLDIIADHINTFFNFPALWTSQQNAWLLALKRSRTKIKRDTGIDYKAIDRALSRIWKKELREEIIKSRAYEGDVEWLRKTTRWQVILDLEEEAKREYGPEWLKREELVWYPLLPLPEHRIIKHIALEKWSRQIDKELRNKSDA